MLAYLHEFAAESPCSVPTYLKSNPFLGEYPSVSAEKTKTVEGCTGTESATAASKPHQNQENASDEEGEELIGLLEGMLVSERRGACTSDQDIVPTPLLVPYGAHWEIPRGTQLQFVCIEGFKIVMRSAAQNFRVLCNARDGVRVDAKVDFHLLVAIMGPENISISFDSQKSSSKFLQRAVGTESASL